MSQQLEEYAQLLIESGELTLADWETYKSLEVERYRYKNRLAIKAPTWKMRNPTRTLGDFIDDLANPKTRARARRDFASLPGGGKRPFFQEATILKKNAEPNRKCPINDGSGVVQTGEAINVASWLQPDLLASYTLAADFSTSRDRTGIALVHFDQSTRRYVLDFSFQIQIPPGARVDYRPFRELARELRNRGFRIAAIGFDQHQSNDTFNLLEDEGFICEVVKYADSLQGCNTIHELIHAGRLIYGECDRVFLGEAEELQVVNDKRIDHLSSEGVHNSKDVWDAVVNAIFLCQKYVQDNQGEALQLSDLDHYPSNFDFFYTEPITSSYPSAELRKRQLPNNGHALLAYVYCRYNDSQDPDTVIIALGAVSMKDNSCKVIELKRLKQTPRQLAQTLLGMEEAYRDKPFFQTRRGQSIEFFAPDLPFLDHLKRTFAEEAPSIDLTKADVSLSAHVRLSSLQAFAKEGKVLFPSDFENKPRLRWFASQLVAYPYVPKEYGILALEGLVRMALDVEFVLPTLSSRVFNLSLGDL